MTLHAKHPRKPCGVLTTYHKFIFPKNLRKNESELSPCPTRSYCIILAGAKSGAHRGAPNHGHAGRPASGSGPGTSAHWHSPCPDNYGKKLHLPPHPRLGIPVPQPLGCLVQGGVSMPVTGLQLAGRIL